MAHLILPAAVVFLLAHHAGASTAWGAERASSPATVTAAGAALLPPAGAGPAATHAVGNVSLGAIASGGRRADARDDAARAGDGARADTTGPASGAVSRPAGDATTPLRDLGALAPEFRARLERVLDRMQEEFGHEVAVVETRRSQLRQEALYAQGRTRSGPVVTWTRNSAHLGGYAADVVIDSSYSNAAAYARLAALARQEGLRTLGPRDPGHVELPGASGRLASAGAFGSAYGGSAFGGSAFGAAGDAPVGSARALSRIVRSTGAARPAAEPTVFASSPYAAAMSPATGSFLNAAAPDDGRQRAPHTGHEGAP